MDVVLGVAVTGPVARLALVGPGADVIDQSVVDLEENPVGKLTETVVGTNRLLADENHRLVGTRVCWSDDPRAGQLRQALEDSGVSNVALLSDSQAVAALMRAAGRPGAAALVLDDATATLSVPGSADDQNAPPTVLAREAVAGGDATAMFNTMMAQLSAQADAPGDVYLVGASPELAQVADQFRDASTMRVQVADDPSFAIARGAAMAAAAQTALSAGDATAMAPAVGLTGDETAMAPGLTGDETAMAPGLTGDETTLVPPADVEEPQLAYSMTDDAEPFAGDEYGPEYDDVDDFDETTAIPSRLSRRSLVVGNAVLAFAVIGFASLAAAVAIAVRPTASQQPVVGHQNAAPGKFMPLLPTQQQAPVPPPPVDQPNAGFQGGVIPDANGLIPAQGGGPAVPAAPVSPGFVPNPNPAVPVPVPIIVPVPVYPPYNPPTFTTPTTTTTITTTTPTTTTPTTTTPTTTEPSTTTPTTTTPTTTTPHVTTTTPPTSSKEPYTSTQAPTTQAPPPSTHETTAAPHTQNPQTLAPQEPRIHRGF
ncbi:hypothetical protein [Mycobacterium sp. 852014-50255_SCH5639931]|uniref:hypothetical protein n=1 Tax=Mycobacterium sp. 852014-50255_SCH5639931 TaxID=1834112 RepID=UPI0007FDFA19|nr:hypothetical protein [Mycobacterium sp. 852014-50255_SCH5639931]OBB67220.1 hypothetical protein A5758_12225 [Mycobacterium sp. 852014-50255_SCH5639931]